MYHHKNTLIVTIYNIVINSKKKISKIKYFTNLAVIVGNKYICYLKISAINGFLFKGNITQFVISKNNGTSSEMNIQIEFFYFQFHQ
jgi:hypothetical protein